MTVTFFCLEAEATDYTITILPDEVTQDDLHDLGGILNTAESSEKVSRLLRRLALTVVEETNKNLSARIDDLKIGTDTVFLTTSLIDINISSCHALQGL